MPTANEPLFVREIALPRGLGIVLQVAATALSGTEHTPEEVKAALHTSIHLYVALADPSIVLSVLTELMFIMAQGVANWEGYKNESGI